MIGFEADFEVTSNLLLLLAPARMHPMSWTGESRSVEHTLSIARAVAQQLRPGDVIALIGELGAGKTQFVHGLAEGLGIAGREVASPTFVIVHEYHPSGDRPPLLHVDAYRLQNLDDLATTGWDRPYPEMRRGAIVAVEWADRITGQLGEDRLEVVLSHIAETRRRLILTPHGRWTECFDQLTHSLNAIVGSAPATCPICSKSADPQEPIYPFCSERCKTIDLGRWIDQKYVISRSVEQSDLDQGE